MKNKIIHAGFLSITLGMLAACSDDTSDIQGANSGTEDIIDRLGNENATVNQDNVCLMDSYTGIYAADSVTVMCLDGNGALAFWINADGTYGFPETNAGSNASGASSADGETGAINSSGSVVPESGSSAGGSNTDGADAGGTSAGDAGGTSAGDVGGTSASDAGGSGSNGPAPAITYTAAGAAVTGKNDCVTVSGGEVVITCAGDYDFSGEYSGADAQIRVYAPKSDSGVYLNLRGLALTNTSDAPIYVQMASKAFVVAKSGTVNTLKDASTRTKKFTYANENGSSKEDTTGACIYAKDDLTIKGEGTLNVFGNYNNGIHSSNDLRFRGATTVNVEAKNNGLKGKGTVDIEKGSITITAKEGDGIKSDEGEDEGAVVENKGVVSIKGGFVKITAADDGIQAYNYVFVNDTLDAATAIEVTAGSGTPDKTSSGMGGMGGMGGWNRNSSSSTAANSASSKGIVGGTAIQINSGKVTVAAYKDALHSNGTVTVNGGKLSLTGRNGIHADAAIYVKGGTIDVPDSYEGFESPIIDMAGGVTSVFASDDGWNATDQQSESCTSCKVNVTGGFHYVRVGSGDTDGIDSNGYIYISGGYVAVENTNTSGGTSTAFDCGLCGGGMGGMGGMGGGNRGNSSTGSSDSFTGGYIIGFAPSTEVGTSYSVSFNSNNFYGSENWACKPTTSSSRITAYPSQPSQVTTTGMTRVEFGSSKFECFYK